jgi:hypothetical protein
MSPGAFGIPFDHVEELPQWAGSGSDATKLTVDSAADAPLTGPDSKAQKIRRSAAEEARIFMKSRGVNALRISERCFQVGQVGSGENALS